MTVRRIFLNGEQLDEKRELDLFRRIYPNERLANWRLTARQSREAGFIPQALDADRRAEEQDDHVALSLLSWVATTLSALPELGQVLEIREVEVPDPPAAEQEPWKRLIPADSPV